MEELKSVTNWDDIIPKENVHTQSTSRPVKKSKEKIDPWTSTVTPLEPHITTDPKDSKDYSTYSLHDIPDPIKEKIHIIAKNLTNMGYCLRIGLDEYSLIENEFLNIVRSTDGCIKCYLPWAKWNNNKIDKDKYKIEITKPSVDAYKISAYFMDKYNELKPVIRSLLARNVHQILGKDLNSPIKFLICYDKYETEKVNPNKPIVTTLSFQIALCEATNIPVFNIKKEESLLRFIDYIKVN